MPREPRVLVVSDDEETGSLVRSILAARGWAVACIGNRDVTLERLDVGRPDLVVLDMFTPVLDQWSIVDHLARLRTRPVLVALTGRCLSPGALAALTLAIRGQLSKPFAPEELVELCERLLAPSGQPRREPEAPERRAEERRTFVGEATVLTGKGRPALEVRVSDVSPSGAQLDVGPLPESVLVPGQRVHLILTLPPTFEPREREVRIEWQKESKVGVRFIGRAAPEESGTAYRPKRDLRFLD